MPHAAGSPVVACQSTQHAMLIVWGYFAQTLRLRAHLEQVPILQKTVRHSPGAKLLTFLLGLLSGIEYLADLSTGAAPLCKDPAVATAWGLDRLADASSVSRLLAACDPQAHQVLQIILDEVAQPFLDCAIADLRTRPAPLLLDVDLTGRAVSDTSQTYPDAAFGYMDGELHLGYQVAAICLHTTLYGRQWLCGQQHPGNTVSAPCLANLVIQAKRRLGCHPRRRVELLDWRITTAQQRVATTEQQLARCQAQSAALLECKEQLRRELNAAQRRVGILQERPALNPAAPYGLLVQAHRHLRECQHQWQLVEEQQRHLRHQHRCALTQIATLRATLTQLQARRATLATENMDCASFFL